MMSWILANLLGIGAGIVVKILVPMPFIDQPVRDAYAFVLSKFKGG